MLNVRGWDENKRYQTTFECFIVQPNQGGRCVLGTSKIYAKPISSESESSMHNK